MVRLDLSFGSIKIISKFERGTKLFPIQFHPKINTFLLVEKGLIANLFLREKSKLNKTVKFNNYWML
jgi:hypothetical protein